MKGCFALGPALRLLRSRRGLAVQAVAQRIDTWPASYSRYERGGSDMRCATLGRILDALGAQLNELAAAVAFARTMGLEEASDSSPLVAKETEASQSAVGSGAWWRDVAREWTAHWNELWRLDAREGSPKVAASRDAACRKPRARRASRGVPRTAPGCDLDDTELVGQGLRLLRLRRELEIEHVAERLGVYSQQLGAYENGSRGMLVGTLIQILETLGYSLVDLQEMLVLARYLFRRPEPSLPVAQAGELPAAAREEEPRRPVLVASAEWQRRRHQAEQELKCIATAHGQGADLQGADLLGTDLLGNVGVRLALFALGCRIWPPEREVPIAKALRAATVGMGQTASIAKVV